MSELKHLQKAKTLLDQGDGFGAKKDERYRQAADEILAAKAENPALSNRTIAKEIGRSYQWVNDLLAAAADNNIVTFSPYSERYEKQKATQVKNGVKTATVKQLDSMMTEDQKAALQELWQEESRPEPVRAVHREPRDTTKSKAETVRELLSDPDVVEEVAKDRSTVISLESAMVDDMQEKAAARQSKDRKTSGLQRTREVLDLMSHFVYIKTRIHDACRTAQLAILTKDDRAVLIEDVAKCQIGLDALKDLLGGESLSDEVEAFLVEQEAS